MGKEGKGEEGREGRRGEGRGKRRGEGRGGEGKEERGGEGREGKGERGEVRVTVEKTLHYCTLYKGVCADQDCARTRSVY